MDPPGSNSDRSDKNDEAKDSNTDVGTDADEIDVANLVDETEQEQFRLMAIIEANLRVQDLTGFDRAEYDRQQRANQQNNPRIRPRPMHFFFPHLPVPRPTLPDPPRLQNLRQPPSLLSSSISSSATSTRTSSSSAARPQEASLPPRRANRWYNEHPRATAVPELCDGVVVQLPDGTIVDDDTCIIEEQVEDVKQEEESQLQGDRPRLMASMAADPYHIIVDCLGCGCRLRAHRLASLVNCSRCFTVSPTFPPEEERRK
jgi:hypothetical protein